MSARADTPLSVGLRFRYRDRLRLRELAHAIERGELRGDRATFDQAAVAAETGEPLVVKCMTLMEAQLVAGGYIRCGVTPTSIETLTSRR